MWMLRKEESLLQLQWIIYKDVLKPDSDFYGGKIWFASTIFALSCALDVM